MGTDDFEYLGDGGFVGERSCGLRLAALRAHPHFFDFLNGKLRFGHNFQRDKCKRGLVREMKRMIVLVRNPYYRIVKPIFETFPPEDVTTVKYEDLLNPAKQVATMQALLQFMQYKDVSDEQVSCAFLLADKPFVHRNPHDPHRVPAKTAFLVGASTVTATNSGAGATQTVSATLAIDGNNIAHSPEMTHHKNVLCQMREHFAGMSKHFNYTLAPVSMDATGLCDIKPVVASRA